MPEMDGFEVAKRIKLMRQDFPKSKMKVIAHSAVQKKFLLDLQEKGFDRFIPKPMTLESLSSLMK